MDNLTFLGLHIETLASCTKIGIFKNHHFKNTRTTNSFQKSR